MNEAPYSANFQMYQGKLKLQFTYRQAADAAYIANLQAYIANLYSAGFTDEPTTPAEGGEEHTVTAYVLGLANDKNTGGKQPCIFCYTDYFDMCAFVLYSNHIEMLPFEVERTQPWQGWRPPKADAEGAGWLIPCEPFTVTQEVMTDWKTGEPLLYEDGPGKGKPKKFISHINGQPVPRNGDSAPVNQVTPVPVNGNGNGHKPAPRNQVTEDQPFDDDSAGPGMTDAEKATLHALGTTLYAKGWDTKRAELCKHLGVNSSNELTSAQARKLIHGMERKLYEQLCQAAGTKKLSIEAAHEITKSERNGKPLDKLTGVALTKAYRLIDDYVPFDMESTEEVKELPF